MQVLRPVAHEFCEERSQHGEKKEEQNRKQKKAKFEATKIKFLRRMMDRTNICGNRHSKTKQKCNIISQYYINNEMRYNIRVWFFGKR